MQDGRHRGREDGARASPARGALPVTVPRVILVVKRTPYARYVEEESDPEVRRLVRRRDPSVAVWVESHREHVATLAEVSRVLKKLGAKVWLLQGPRVVFDASDAALVVSVGGDGTLLAASHHVGRTPVIGVNSSPRSSVGFFCAARRANVETLLSRALSGKVKALKLSRMMVRVNGRVISRHVLNEALFCHETPAAASRYVVSYRRRQEEQVSSGFWVGTAAGSTGRFTRPVAMCCRSGRRSSSWWSVSLSPGPDGNTG